VAEPQVSRNRFAYCRKNWHQAGFSAFAKDPKRLRSAWERGVAHRGFRKRHAAGRRWPPVAD
jgi:hypothetical protein